MAAVALKAVEVKAEETVVAPVVSSAVAETVAAPVVSSAVAATVAATVVEVVVVETVEATVVEVEVEVMVEVTVVEMAAVTGGVEKAEVVMDTPYTRTLARRQDTRRKPNRHQCDSSGTTIGKKGFNVGHVRFVQR